MKLKSLHTKIRKARLEAGFKFQKDLAKQINVTVGAVSQWESDKEDKRTIPSLENVLAIAQVTGFYIGWFLDDEVEAPNDASVAAFRNRLGEAIEKLPFGDTADSFAQFVRQFK